MAGVIGLDNEDESKQEQQQEAKAEASTAIWPLAGAVAACGLK